MSGYVSILLVAKYNGLNLTLMFAENIDVILQFF